MENTGVQQGNDTIQQLEAKTPPHPPRGNASLCAPHAAHKLSQLENLHMADTWSTHRQLVHIIETQHVDHIAPEPCLRVYKTHTHMCVFVNLRNYSTDEHEV